MFNQTYEERLQQWSNFRESLELSSDPLQDVIDQYKFVPTVSIHTDPWSQDMWPNPWELIQENQYCDFCIVLGQCYSLQLTDRFSGSDFEIHIGIDNSKSADYYLLQINDRVIGYDKNTHVHKSDLPKTLQIQKSYPMQKLQ